MTNLSTEAFSRLLSPYFSQDWHDEFFNFSAAISAVVASEPKELFRAVCGEIDNLLAASLTEGELEKIVRDQAGCFFAPQSEGYTYRSWLKEVRHALSYRND